MATIAIGDIHGNLGPLMDLLAQLRREVAPHDTVVFLGDYIDGGPGARECVDAILEFRDVVESEVICLCGNHEDWLLRTMRDPRRHSWLLGMEAFDTIGSYSAEAARALRDAASAQGPALYESHVALPYDRFFDAVPEAHLKFFRSLLPCHETADCLCVHGGLDPRVPRLQEQSREALLWGADGFPDGYEGARVVVYGHRNDAELDSEGWPTPRRLARTIGIDTIAHGVLTAVRLPDRAVFQSARYPTTG